MRDEERAERKEKRGEEHARRGNQQKRGRSNGGKVGNSEWRRGERGGRRDARSGDRRSARRSEVSNKARRGEAQGGGRCEERAEASITGSIPTIRRKSRVGGDSPPRHLEDRDGAPDVHEIPIDRLPMIRKGVASFAFLCTEDDKSFQKMDDSRVFFRWDDTIPEDLIRAAYDRACGHKVHRIDAQVKEETCATVYVIDEAWRRYLEYLGERGLPCQSSQATANRNTEVEGPGTGPSKHDGGSVSFVTTQERLTPPTVNELYLHLHTVNHDGMTFIDTRSERFYAPEEMSGAHPATPDQSVDDEAVYLNVAGECPKGRVYGLGSLERKKRRYARSRC
ncbi:hypothetical protein Sjap_022258 [Stephania japonica]|uniref:Uncharacterized protein n=1 Tax=Stephania japonica TaxID=461633 RepID=A0AAP0EP22_9MAGN